MYKKWGERIFGNIKASEQTHMDAIKTLLDRYGLPDPAAGKGVGEFENLEIQGLYNELIARGNLSFEEALNVGVDIEEMDIEDLNDFIATAVKRDIKKVYTNLREGSYHHLAAFEYQL